MRILFALTGMSLIAIALLAVPGAGEDRTVVLNAHLGTSTYEWLPNAPITIAPGDTIDFVVFNNDTTAHNFGVSGQTPAINVDLPVGGNTNQTATFPTAGTQYVFCGVAGHASDTDGNGVKDSGMVVRINVVTPGTNGKTPGPEILLLALVVLGVVAALRFSRRTR